MPFRIILFVCFGVLVIGLWGCGSHEDKTENGSNLKTDSIYKNTQLSYDTTISIIINGNTKTMNVSKSEAIECKEIEKLAAKFKGRKLDSTLVRYIDITGDGIAEKISGHVFIARDSAFVIKTFYHNNNILFVDSTTDCLNDTNEEDNFGITPNLSQLEPFATFNEMIPYIDILKDTIKMNLPDFMADTSVSFRSLEDSLINNKLSESEYKKKSLSLRKYAQNFKGAILRKDYEDGVAYLIWYEPWKRFIEFSDSSEGD